MSSDFALTNRLRKEFASLDDVKGRRRSGLFVAEGTKCVLELAAAFTARYVFARPDWIEEHAAAFDPDCLIPAAPAMLRELTRLTATPPVVAFFELPESPAMPDEVFLHHNLVLALDCVQDPGNLGTIIRTCDWMGVRTIVAGRDTADAFNPKTVQATMGALARTRVVYTDIAEWLATVKVPVYGTFLDGDNIYRLPLSENGIIVMGNEGRGISDAVAASVTSRLFIPPYPGDTTVESLNVATATAIALSQFRARLLCK